MAEVLCRLSLLRKIVIIVKIESGFDAYQSRSDQMYSCSLVVDFGGKAHVHVIQILICRQAAELEAG